VNEPANTPVETRAEPEAVPSEHGAGRAGRKLRAVGEWITGPWTRQNFYGWIIILLTVVLIRWLWFEPRTIPTGSMEPTLYGSYRFLEGDRVAVNKFIYGPKVPFMNKRLFRLADPKRWEIVVFSPSCDDDGHTPLVKRVVGLPGERIQIRNGRVYANGTLVPFSDDMPADTYYVNNEDLDRLMAGLRTEDERRQLHEIREQYPYVYGVRPEDEYAIVPDNCYLVLGDNSMDSVDGRCFGWVPNDHLIGRVFCIWWKPSRWRDFTGFSHTWWGRSILGGVPGLFFLYEIMAVLRRRSTRHRVADGAATTRLEE